MTQILRLIWKGNIPVEKIFTDNGGKVTKIDNWGKRKLAYPIKKHEAGIYIFTLLISSHCRSKS